MGEQRIDTGDTPHVMLTLCGGDVSVASWQRKAVEIIGEAFSAEMPEVDVVQVQAETAVSLHIPLHSRLTLADVSGSVTIKHISGLVNVGAVQGSVTLSTVGNVQVKSVGSSLHGEGIDGPLTVSAVSANTPEAVILRNTANVTIQQIQGGVSIRYANGDVELGTVSGSLDLHTISGSLHVAQAGSTARLSNLGGEVNLPDVQGVVHLAGGLVEGEHLVAGQSDLFLYWPNAAPLSLLAEASRIHNGIKLQRITETAVSDTITSLSGYIEHQKTRLRLQTPARIGLLPWDGNAEPSYVDGEKLFAPPPEPTVQTALNPVPMPAAGVGIETAVSRGVAEVLASIELELGPEWKHRFVALELDERLRAAIAAEFLDHKPPKEANANLAATAVTPGMAAFAKAEEQVQKSLHQAEESIEVARGRLGKSQTAETAEKLDTAVAASSDEPAAAHSAAQLRILDMLEKGVITVEQASQLLQAL